MPPPRMPPIAAMACRNSTRDGAQAKSSGGAPSYTSVFGQALTDEAARDERVVAVTAAMPDGTGVSKMAERFPGVSLTWASPSSMR